MNKIIPPRVKDMTNLITDKGIKVIEFDEIKNGEAYWICECPICFTHWSVRGSRLRGKNQISACKNCTSLHNLITKLANGIITPYHKDLTNQRFGKLVALYPTDERLKTSVIWVCKCDCGNLCKKASSYLINGDTKSCGCLNKSYYETVIEDILKENDIPFIREHHFKDCIGRFDFYVDNKYIIEFDGKQHFYYDETGYGADLKNIRKRDLEKNKYCFFNNIPIIRIPFDKSEKICYNNLRIETSEFILTEENENEYYRIN